VFTKDEIKTLKLYLSSLTARRAHTLYHNITEAKNEYIFANMEPDAVVKFCESTFGVHFVTVKDKDINNLFTRLLKIFPLPSEYYILKMSNVITFMNKHNWDVKPEDFIFSDEKVLYYETPGPKGSSKKTILGFPLLSFQAVYFIREIKDCYDKINTDENDTYKFKPVDEKALDSGIITTEYTPEEYGIESNLKSFNVLLVDGAETVSVKEFIKKQKGNFNRFDIVTWVNGDCIEYGSFYDDDHITVKSTRPHTRIYLKPRRKRKK